MSEEVKTEEAATAAPAEAGKAYLVSYNGDYQEVSVEGFDTKEIALEAVAKAAKEHALVIETVKDLEEFDGSQLLAIYNGISGSTLSKFRSLESGRERILTSIKGLAAAVAAGAETGAVEGTEGEEVGTKKKATKKKAATPKPAGERKKRKSSIDADSKIIHTDTFKDAKLRDGSSRKDDFALMKNNLKVSTYLEKGGSQTNLRFAIIKKYVKLEG